MLIVKKYGGSSVSTPEKILEVAKRLKILHEQNYRLIIIVSAMSDGTDDLVGLSRRVTHTPIQREMDMLLSAGERVSMALMSMALNSLGCDAISFTGSQSGVFTDGSHNSARVIAIKAIRVKEELDRGRIVIIAGFQGVDPLTKEITTLGRGGSDTTAVAMAAHFGADRCDILTDVRGVYSADPRISAVAPRHFHHLDYHITMEMAYWGARVLHYRSVELAERENVDLLVHLSSEEGAGTLINAMEQTQITAVNYNVQLACLCFDQDYDLKGALTALHEGLRAAKLPTPQIIYERTTQKGREIFLSAPLENFDGVRGAVDQWAKNHHKSAPVLNRHLATVTLTGRGIVNSDVAFEMSALLTEEKIETEALIVSPLSLTFIVPESQVHKASQVLQAKFVAVASGALRS